MKVEIWSDVMCPFCYIGKRRLEDALQQLPFNSDIEVEWKSYQLDPDIKNEPGKNVNQYLAERKGVTVSYARQMNEQVTRMAAEAGLEYNLDKAVVANSFDAHRFSHLAAQHGLGNEAEELIFKAYFTEGKNIADIDTLVQLGTEIGLDAAEVKQALETNAHAQAVQQDIDEATAIGVRGVPFFVLDRKYAVSGAQPVEVFKQALEGAYTEWKAEKEKNTLTIVDGPSCSPNGDCK
jgi:predicted DsbA family dithiol-disulfide isomerase